MKYDGMFKKNFAVNNFCTLNIIVYYAIFGILEDSFFLLHTYKDFVWYIAFKS